MEKIHPQARVKMSNIVWLIVMAVLGAMALNALITNDAFHWDVVGRYLFDWRILRGIVYTLVLTGLAMVIGIILALTMAVLRESSNAVLRAAARFYIWFFRGTPIYTQLMFWGLLPSLYQKLSLGIPFGPEFFTFQTDRVITPFIAAIIGLGLNEGAYLAEIIRSGLGAIDPGQREAAVALGMRSGTIMRHIILPQAMRIIIPPTGNETISMLKTTSLVLAVPFTLDLTFAAQDLGSKTYLPFPFLVVAAIWYLVITSLLMMVQHRIERHFARGFDGRTATTAFLDVTP
ncbi:MULTISPECIES: amino acid ABC transporter permease [Actinotignum]|uniref:Amino acid ABC transporter permease n=1 Tax=Actinotignum timonense TaxID=1870995 RepID=A0AAW9HFC4_9ACTO|nr:MULTISPECIES: amino acid ABC transporter permease [Actinotignum]MDE1558193.1 amino acid ABC transporter permease [Actinotignum schaalii]MDE1663110.1 amino acid ABC transporter permease [Actinotignum schaalii]MDK6372931.1 amino acid ABC transporter permease [Actinotignum timonense]MDK6419483.1 amino acid ABC transporter permease [Actinotignum timonense]MDK6645472.1 amino acid ABC transporter permease [Actinotignum timonense]